MKSPKFKHNIQVFLPLSFLAMMVMVVVVVIYSAQHFIKPMLLKEKQSTMIDAGRGVVYKINSMLGQAENAASLMSYTAMSLVPNQAAIKKTIPGVFDIDSLAGLSAGGGIWPEPFLLDPKKEKASLFWGRNRKSELIFYNDYNVSGYHHEEWYVPVRFVKKGRAYWSRSYIDPYSHEPMITCAIPMTKKGRFRGVATVDLKLAGLKRLFSRVSKEIRGYIFAVDRNNRFIVFPREGLVQLKGKDHRKGQIQKFITSKEFAKRQPEFAPIAEKLEKINQNIISIAQKHGSVHSISKKIYENAQDISKQEALLIAAILTDPLNQTISHNHRIESFKVQKDVLFHKPSTISIFLLPETYWKLVVTVPDEIMMTPVNYVTNKLMLFLAILIVLVLFLAGTSLYHHILLPLKRITTQLKHIEKNSEDLSVELDIPSNNELGELAYYFNLRTKALRNSEEKYRTIFNGASEGISMSTIDGDFITVNPRFARIFGYDSSEELVSNVKTHDLYVNLADRENILWRIKHGKGPVHTEVWFKKKDGSPILISLNIAPVTDKKGEIKYLIAMIQDITRTKQLEDELRHAQKMEAIGTLAGGIAHDFNNILAVISGYTELAIMKAKGVPEVEKFLKQIELASIRAKELVSQILVFSRYSDVKRQVLNVSDTVQEALKLLRSTLPANIRIDAALKNTGAVLADPSELHQIVMNLCTNAYHAMRPKGGILRIRLSQQIVSHDYGVKFNVEPGEFVVLEVEDTGHGMDKDTLAKIFEPYFTTKGQNEGTGLGLAVVHGIVKKLGGFIEVKSIPSNGSCFKVYLPVAEDRGSGPQDHKKSESGNPSFYSGYKVMFVDDEEMICSIFKILLEDVGCDVKIFTDPVKALKLFAKNPLAWDLLITDMTMPGMSGTDFIKKARRLNKKLPVVLCSGYSEVLSDELIESLHIDAFLPKPVQSTELLKTLSKIFAHSKRISTDVDES